MCSASKMSNIIVPLRGTYYGRVHLPQAAPRRGLPAVKHGSAPSAHLRWSLHNRLVGRTEYELSESATALRLWSLGRLLLSPRSRLRFAYRQHGVIEVATAPRLCVGCCLSVGITSAAAKGQRFALCFAVCTNFCNFALSFRFTINYSQIFCKE